MSIRSWGAGPEAKLSGRGTVASGVMAAHAWSATPADDRPQRRVRILSEVAAATRPHDEVGRLRRAPIRKCLTGRERAPEVRERRAARGACGEGHGRRRIVDALRVHRPDHERLEGVADLGREAPPDARRLEEQRLVLASPQLAVIGGREAGVAEERVRPVEERRREVDRAGCEGVRDEALRRRRLRRRRLARARGGAAVGQTAVETFARLGAVANAVAAEGGERGRAKGAEA